MGKILTYLNASEENQSRDILDAERLLEGMQAIYATAPSGAKKDNFAVPLAEMTKIFIEKLKGITPKEQPKEEQKQELNFKVGDVFKQDVGAEHEKEYGVVIFTILSFDEEKQFVKIERKNLKTKETKEFVREISKVVDDVDVKWWIPYVDGNFQFKVGDKVRIAKDSYWYNNGNKRKDLIGEIIEVKNGILNYKVKWEDNIIDLFGDYDLELATQEEDNTNETFEVGDMFYSKDDGEDYIYQVLKIDGQVFTYVTGNKGEIEVFEDAYTTNEANKNLKNGSWVKISKEKSIPPKTEQPKDDKQSKGKQQPNQEEFVYNVGDVYYNTERDEKLIIKEVNKNNIVVTYEDFEMDILSINTSKALIKDGYWVKVEDNTESKQEDKNYKVGDKFIWAKENMPFVIDFINNDRIGFTYSDGLTGFLTPEQFEKGLSTGYYKPFVEQSEPKKERKKREPRTKNVPKTKTEQEKTIEHLLDINVDEIEF